MVSVRGPEMRRKEDRSSRSSSPVVGTLAVSTPVAAVSAGTPETAPAAATETP